jgi:hypothetical protein
MIEIELTPEERKLLLRYGYPFEPIAEALRNCAKSRRLETIPMSPFYLNKLIGDLCRSINDMADGTVQDKLNDLYHRLEAAERQGDGRLDAF